ADHRDHQLGLAQPPIRGPTTGSALRPFGRATATNHRLLKAHRCEQRTGNEGQARDHISYIEHVIPSKPTLGLIRAHNNNCPGSGIEHECDPSTILHKLLAAFDLFPTTLTGRGNLDRDVRRDERAALLCLRVTLDALPGV